jgi:hypothetical protein
MMFTYMSVKMHWKTPVTSLLKACKMLLLLKSNYEITPWNAETLSYRKLHLTHYIKPNYMNANVREKRIFKWFYLKTWTACCSMTFISRLNRQTFNILHDSIHVYFWRKWNRQKKCLDMTHENKKSTQIMSLNSLSVWMFNHFSILSVGNNLRKW